MQDVRGPGWPPEANGGRRRRANLHEDSSGDQAAPEQGRVTYRDVLAVAEYRHLFAANVLSLLGDQLSKVALSLLVFQKTGSPLLTAMTYAVSFLPWVAGGPVLSAYADRFPRRDVLIACDLTRAALIGLLAIPWLPTGSLIAVLFLATMLAPPFRSARAAILPDVMGGDRYVVANGLDSIVRQLMQVVGFLAGGAIVAILSPRGGLIVDAATFALSALIIRTGVRNRPTPERDGPLESIWRDTVDGARFVFGNPALRAYILLFWVSAAFTYAPEGLAAPYARDLGGGPAAIGIFLAAAPIGVITGSVVLSRLCAPATRVRLLIPFALLSCVALVPVLWLQSLPLTVALLVIAGFGSAFAIVLNAMFVRAVPAAYRGRAIGVAVAGGYATQGVATISAGALAEHLATGTVIGLSGVVGTLFMCALAVMWPSDLVRKHS
jgi:predicted MFS family arabinose efflux permease